MSLPCYVCGYSANKEQIHLIGRCEKTLGRCICLECKDQKVDSTLDFSAPGPELSEGFKQFFEELHTKVPGYYGSTRNEDGSYTWFGLEGASYTAHLPPAVVAKN